MGKCRTCKQWNSVRCPDHPVFGVCENRKLWPVAQFNPQGLRGRDIDELAYSIRDRGWMSVVYTGMNFGCIHHKEKE